MFLLYIPYIFQNDRTVSSTATFVEFFVCTSSSDANPYKLFHGF